MSDKYDHSTRDTLSLVGNCGALGKNMRAEFAYDSACRRRTGSSVGSGDGGSGGAAEPGKIPYAACDAGETVDGVAGVAG